MDLFDPDYLGRDNALANLQLYRADVIHTLRDVARNIWDTTREPVSVNDLREEMNRLQYDGDPRLLGAVFMKSAGWIPCGFTQVKGSKAHARMIRTFRRND